MAEQQGYGEVLWSPSAESCRQSNLTRFVQQQLPQKLSTASWAELHQWSITEFKVFWSQLAQFYGLDLPGPVYEDSTWFPAAHFNMAQYLLQTPTRYSQLNPGKPALISISESGIRRTLSWHELQNCVLKMASFLQQREIRPGDRIAAIVPNQLEAVICALATAMVGAVWTSCSPDFGVAALNDRLGQVQPRLLIACDGYAYKGQIFSTQVKIEAILQQVPSLEALVLIPYAATLLPKIDWVAALSWTHKRAYHFQAVLECGDAVEPKAFPFSAPLSILYSSGTTGKPKCILHSAGGTLLQHLKEQGLHTDIKPGETLFYYSTCGWMMWNWLVSGLGVGATLVLFDGNPLYPEPSRLLQMAAAEELEHFGASAKYYAALANAGVTHQDLNLKSLRTVLSTGSPLLPETFDYIYRDIKADVRVASISGGTDIVSCFALGNPWLPVRRGELQGAGLGMALAVVNEQGQTIIDTQGELVCRQVFPSQPLGFWQDPQQVLYKAAYFSRFPGIWAQGDCAIQSKFGGFIILGRSDAVLNPGGVRIGTAEIYRQVESLAMVADALAAGQSVNDDEIIWLFVQLQAGVQLDSALAQQIRAKIRTNASPRHVPTHIVQAPDLPRTRSGKIAELAVKKILNGQTIDNQAAFANPECLAFFTGLVANPDSRVF